MSERYYIGGEWCHEYKARQMLEQAAAQLEHSNDARLRDGAKLIRDGWRVVACRPGLADRLIADAETSEPWFCDSSRCWNTGSERASGAVLCDECDACAEDATRAGEEVRRRDDGGAPAVEVGQQGVEPRHGARAVN